MTTAAEPRPAQLPLTGGRTDATVKLHPLLVATMTGPAGHFHRDDARRGRLGAALEVIAPRERIELPVVAFLVEHPGAGLMLIDTAFHAGVAAKRSEAMGRAGGLLFKDVKMQSEDAVPGQLRSRGIDPHEVRVVVMTHLHSDHASGISQFPDATFVVSDREWDAASEGSQLKGYFRRQFDHAFDWRLLDFEGPQAGSFATFGRAFDLFGDGSVQLVFTPGHSLGHMSVVLRLEGGREALIAGDAIYTMRTLRDSALPFLMPDEHLFKRSLREIQLFVKGSPDAVVIPGHDLERWRELPKDL
jgi:N-acyl homoserine lactone hydrolase